MPKSKKIKSSFSPQPYPLYVWGMWVNQTVNEETKKLEAIYNIDRLTIVGWQDYGLSRIEPMVVHMEHGIIALKTLTSELGYLSILSLDADIRDELEEQLEYTQFTDEFLVVDIAISVPEKELFDTAEKIHRIESQHQYETKWKADVEKMAEITSFLGLQVNV